MKRSPEYGPRYGGKKFAEGGQSKAPKAKTPPNISANEGIAPPLTPDRRKFLKEMEAEQNRIVAEGKKRAAESAAKSKKNAAAREKEQAEMRAQDEADRKYREAADKYEREHKFRKGGSVKKYARGGGIEVRGKTRGKFV